MTRIASVAWIDLVEPTRMDEDTAEIGITHTHDMLRTNSTSTDDQTFFPQVSITLVRQDKDNYTE
jgi:hypothetical protein